METMFCTIVSKYRLHQCIAMYHSLKQWTDDTALAVLAVDKESAKVLGDLKLPDMIIILSEQLEDEELMQLKRQRNPSEYCWTLKPVLLLHLYEKYNNIKIFTYLDSDIYFFDNPMKLFKRKDKWSVLLTTHKVNRKANGGFVAFRRSAQAYEALQWWEDRCREWCYSRYDNGRFADQGYLDSLRERYKGVSYIDFPGLNVAAWNYFRYDFEVKDGNIYVDRNRLIFYHFSGLRLKKHDTSIAIYGAEAPCILCSLYMRALKDAINEIEKVNTKVTEFFYSGI